MNQTGTLTGIWSREEVQSRLHQFDWVLIGSLGTLLTLGLIMVFSASYYEGLQGSDPDGLYHFKRQSLWILAGLICFIFLANFPYNLLARASGGIFAFFLLLLVAILAVGPQIFGAQRLLFGSSFQPSEFAKLAVILYSSHWLVSKGDRLQDFNIGLIPYGIMIGLVSILLFLQPDISMTLLIGVTAFALFYVASGNVKQLLLVVGIAAIFTAMVVMIYPYLGERISDFMGTIQDPVNSAGWQERNTVRASIRGGLWGTGIGQGQMKTLWLVLPWTDAIFAVIGEETGLVGSLLVLFLFGVIAFRGLYIAYFAPSTFGQMVAIGIVFLLVIQALLHMAVVLSLFPVTGMTLPFVSYGGSSMVMWMMAMGILVNIDHCRRKAEQEQLTQLTP